MSNVEVIDFVRQRIAEKMNPGEVRNEGAFFHSAYGLWKLVLIVSFEYCYNRPPQCTHHALVFIT